ncbi:hypothetical protein [Pedococcus bigeumensis]|nr:hypothetical protein [Pedococcus bigeumensis]
MKAITTIFESILSTRDNSLIWTPSEGPTEGFAGRNWQWGG